MYRPTWCGPCIEGMPGYHDLAVQLKDNDDIVFLAVSVDSERLLWEKGRAEKSWQAVQHGWLNPVTNQGQLNKGIPYMVIYDAAGKIFKEGNGLNLKEILTELSP